MPIVNGTTYKDGTPQDVISWLETSRERKQRIRIFLGDKETGKCWMDEYDILGHVGRSMGQVKIPLLIHNSRSVGGGAILEDCIIRIDTKGDDGKIATVYKHPSFSMDSYSVQASGEADYSFAAFKIGTPMELHARFKSRAQADRWVLFMKGDRWSK